MISMLAPYAFFRANSLKFHSGFFCNHYFCIGCWILSSGSFSIHSLQVAPCIQVQISVRRHSLLVRLCKALLVRFYVPASVQYFSWCARIPDHPMEHNKSRAVLMQLPTLDLLLPKILFLLTARFSIFTTPVPLQQSSSLVIPRFFVNRGPTQVYPFGGQLPNIANLGTPIEGSQNDFLQPRSSSHLMLFSCNWIKTRYRLPINVSHIVMVLENPLQVRTSLSWNDMMSEYAIPRDSPEIVPCFYCVSVRSWRIFKITFFPIVTLIRKRLPLPRIPGGVGFRSMMISFLLDGAIFRKESV